MTAQGKLPVSYSFASIAFVACASIGFGVFFTWLGRGLAPRFGLVDRPDGRRKIHAKPIAVIGGLALLCSATVSVVLTCLVSDAITNSVVGDLQPMLALLLAAVIISVVGLVDDVLNLRARYKLLGQFAAIGTLIFLGGFEITNVAVFGYEVALGWLSVPVTTLWFLAAINAINLLDGMDGMLGIIGTIILVSLGIMSFSVGHAVDGYIAVALAGGLVGFLRYNLPPASVYLGDCGSMLVGLAISALAIHAALKGPAVAVVAPTALLVLPFLDTAAAIVRRKLTGRGIAAADRGHLHHMLQKKGLATPRALVLVGMLCTIASLGALGSLYFRRDYLAMASALVIMFILVAGGFFGAAELRLIRERLRGVLRNARGTGGEMEVRLQGTADWSEVWKQITETAEEFRFSSVTLDLNAPAWHEGYHRRWTRVGAAEDPLTSWHVDLPLLCGEQIIGRLSVAGNRAEESFAETMGALARILEQTETLAALAAQKSGVSNRVLPKAKPLTYTASA
jgi:UDP-GlcNAc:undecaprenyl-phosphate GlcNAc-1-phosphate transferase